MSQEPNKLLIDEEEQKDMVNRLKKRLSKMECNILELKLKGLKNAEISSLIDKDKKFVENTMFRITKKYKELINLWYNFKWGNIMFDYINGIVSKTVLNYVVVDCNGVGYKIYTPNPYKFKEGQMSKLYVYNHPPT